MKRSRIRRREANRGIVLLVVISLLVLFMLIAVTYAVVAGQYKQAAMAQANFQATGDHPHKDLDLAAYMVLRDAPPGSVLSEHSLLNDLYGGDLSGGVVVDLLPMNNQFDVVTEVSGQFVRFQFSPLGTVSQLAGYYNGCVLTFLSGPAMGYSTRIVGYSPPIYNNMNVLTQAGDIRYEATDSDGTVVPLPRANDRFGINGRPFNGVGPGFDISTGNIDSRVAIKSAPSATVTSIGTVPLLSALLPNYSAYLGDPTTTTGMPLVQRSVHVGGADEPYDVADFHDMWLAYLPSTVDTSPDDLILPSYHRPELVNYWFNVLLNSLLTGLQPGQPEQVFNYPYGLDGIPNNADDSGTPWSTVNANGGSLSPPIPNACDFIGKLKRHIVLRPLQQDHPNFTGGNVNFTLTGPLNAASKIWDVDNDGDGVADSIWIDPGLPVATSPDGRRYKKLFAIMIRDQDGRVNLNAADALAHLNATYTNNVGGPLAGSPGMVALPRGLGVGPADMYLSGVFTTPSSPSALPGEYNSILLGRYGGNGVPGVNGPDAMAWLKTVGIPTDYNTNGLAYGSPPDISGQGAIAVDHFGQPITGYMGQNTELNNHPYEFDPIRGGAADSRYTLGEFERVLRYNDQDVASLPQRLLYTAPGAFSDLRVRRTTTTHSVHIPAPNVQFYPEIRNNTATWAQYLPSNPTTPPQLGINSTPPTILDIFRARLREGMGAGATAAQINAQLATIVPFEILHGQPFDLNRWLGNGLDDNGNGAVDDILEENATPAETIWNGTTPAGYAGVPFNYVNDAPAVIDPRQMYARQLYCLMRALMDDQYANNWQTPEVALNSSAALRQEVLYRRVAQWAINTVEFRDRDAIMTPFEYDVNPFNGWICDGNPNTDEGNDNIDNDGDGMIDEADEKERRLIWGTEYPDLLVSETFAMHDRRVKDTEHDPSQQFRWNSTTMRFGSDPDVDQYRKPEGSLFLELYCPRNRSSNNSAFPQELYDAAGNLDIGRLAPARTFGMAGQQARHPVWRAAICQPPPAGGPQQGIEGIATQSPDSAVFEPSSFGRPIERIVWFAPLDPTNMSSSDANRVFYGRTGALNPQGNTALPMTSNVLLAPNRHLVVGPRPLTRIGSLENGPDGDPNTLDLSPHSLQIFSGPNLDLTVPLFAGGYYGTAAFAYPAIGVSIPQPKGIVCAAKPPTAPPAQAWTNPNYLVGMNVSEPMPQAGNYYREPPLPNDRYADLTVPHDPINNYCDNRPADGQPGKVLGVENKIRTGTYLNHRSIYLQRLANPVLPWNPDPNDPDFGGDFSPALPLNPYITIDWSTIDLTVFSGDFRNRRQTDSQSNVTEWVDQDDEDPFGTVMPPDAVPQRFAGRERGVAVTNNLWSPLTTDPVLTPNDTGDGDHCFDRILTSTLGYLNLTYGTPVTPVAGYEGTPSQGGNPNPFALLTWNNRPFANPLELMMVPASAPSRLGYEFDRWTIAGFNPYAFERDPGTFRGTFNHLLNFFHTAAPGTPPGTAAHYYRLFDFVETPSLFAGTEKWFNPTTFAADPNAAFFRPPYNRLSRFREPGRVNINTMSDQLEWNALTNSYGYNATNFATVWESVRRSRRGSLTSSVGTTFPTYFANPFRTAATADLMPDIGGMRRSGVEATLLRSLPAPNANDPALTPTDPTASATAEFALQSGAQYQHTDNNAYFRYRGINRLSNLVTTHSNVFAMWITIGYFEVEDNPLGPVNVYGPDEGHPDGLRLGQELGADSGTTTRHRAFYIIDRSVPVAYERGMNHNVDRAILLRRFIE